MAKYKVTIKEIGKSKPIESTFQGDVDENFLIKHYGLYNPDIEWYNIEKTE